MIIIDRIEGDVAYIEDNGGIRSINRAELPAEAKEGDALILKNGKLVVDAEGTVARKKRAEELVKKLFR